MLSQIFAWYLYSVVATTILLIWGWPRLVRDSEKTWKNSPITQAIMSLGAFRTTGALAFIVTAPIFLFGIFVVEPLTNFRHGD